MAEQLLSMPPRIHSAQELPMLTSYLFRTVQQLNSALAEVGAEHTLQVIADAAAADTRHETDKGALARYQALKALIIKTADWTLFESEEFSQKLESRYVASSTFGRYQEDTALEISGNSYGIQQLYRYSAGIRSDFGDFDVDRDTWIKTGFLYYDDNGLPVYGVGVGELSTKVTADGETVLDRSNLVGTYTADRISFWQSDAEIAYISAGALHLPSAEITGGTLNIGGGRFSVDALGKLTAREAVISGTVTATAGVIGGCSIRDGVLQIANANITGRIAAEKLDASVITTANFAAQEVNADRITAGTLSTARLSADVITAANFSAQSINADRITSGTLSTARLAADVITAQNFSAQSIDAGQIKTGTISTGRLAADVITTANFSAQAINADRITAGTISTARLDIDVVTTANFSAQSINASQIKSGTIATSRLAADVITTGNFAAVRIDAGQIASGRISTAFLDASIITTSNLSAQNISASRVVSSATNTLLAYATILYMCSTSGAINAQLSYSGVTGYSGGSSATASWYAIANAASDRDIKNSIEALPEVYEAVFDALQPVRFKYNDGGSGRYHTGFIAQDIVAAVEGAGLTTKELAAVIRLSDEEVALRPDKSRWEVRKDELVALNTWQIQKLKKEIAEIREAIKA